MYKTRTKKSAFFGLMVVIPVFLSNVFVVIVPVPNAKAMGLISISRIIKWPRFLMPNSWGNMPFIFSSAMVTIPACFGSSIYESWIRKKRRVGASPKNH